MAARVKPRPSTGPDQMRPILELVRDVVPDPDAFLNTANGALGGETPRDAVTRPAGEAAVRQLVLSYKYGIFS